VTRARADRRELIYVASIFLSAFLLFLLQPMLARLLLPVFGGSPAVWNTCMIFFQVLLLAGYAYAHASLRALGLRRQAVLHGAVLVASLVALPRATGLVVGSTTSPVLSILGTLTLVAGVPFFVLSTNSSLTQRWFNAGGFQRGADPFWLYAASNTGSLVALLAYPLIVEPLFALETQLRYWSIGYVAFVVVSLVCMWMARHADNAEAAPATHAGAARVTTRQRLGWIARAAVASSLLLSITMQITTEVMSAPLFWVLPLALYLVTFIVAFSPTRRPRRTVVAYATMIGIALCFVIAIIPTVFPLWFALVTLLATLFFGALLCHGDLADDRPSAAHLTEFYLWIAAGGAIGGVVNSLVAPVVFKSLVEYPITLVALSLLLGDPRATTARFSWGALRRALTHVPTVMMILATVAAATFVLITRTRPSSAASDGLLQWQFMPVAILIAGVLFAREAGTFAISVTLVSGFMIAGLHFIDPIIDQGRSFFGISRVTENAAERIMLHGVTVHGSQRKDATLRNIPTSYYYPAGPLGWSIAHVPGGARIGVVGLGAGSLATLAPAGSRLAYYEIDALVERMARRDFTYLADAKASVDVRIGDGRNLLAAEPDGAFDLVIVDAFNSDAIPTHLLTDEALAIYMRKLKPAGLLIVHISNRYADLSRVFRGWRAATGQRVAINQYVPSPEEQAAGVRATVAVATARSPAALAPLAQTRQWFWLDDEGPSVHWTDSHVNLLAVLDKNMLKP
jgi:SAM-dependent methyltransferase